MIQINTKDQFSHLHFFIADKEGNIHLEAAEASERC